MREGQSRSGAGRRMTLALVLGTAAAWPVMAEARPRILTPMSAHAVLQRDRPIIVEGSADAGEPVTVTLGSGQASATADRGCRRARLGSPRRARCVRRTTSRTTTR